MGRQRRRRRDGEAYGLQGRRSFRQRRSIETYTFALRLRLRGGYYTTSTSCGRIY